MREYLVVNRASPDDPRRSLGTACGDVCRCPNRSAAGIAINPPQPAPGGYVSRRRLAGKRHISTRPASATNRSRIGHLDVDTVLDDSQGGACIVTLAERKRAMS